jgi:predicted DsbA family dithiol-disulfide isomerase
MSNVSFFVDPSCPWAWVTSRWLVDVAPARDLTITWKSYCIEIRDEYDLAPGFPPERRALGLKAHELSHRMLRVFEAVRAEAGESAVDALYTDGGLVTSGQITVVLFAGGGSVIGDCLAACGMDSSLADAQA